MSRFKSMRGLDPSRQVWFPLPIPWDPTPELLIRHAGHENKGFIAAGMRLSAASGRVARAAQANPVIAAKQGLNLDREAFPGNVITDWRGVVDEKGEPVEFSVEACTEFLRALPDWIMREITQFASRPSNFIGVDEPTEDDYQEQAGN